ncbi:MAG: MarR family transcriptional regulator [Reinekea sp.]|jgi:DNA-binding MarR family transcriptional regulator
MSDKQKQPSMGALDSLLGYKLRRAQLAFFADFAATCSDLKLTPGLFSVMEVAHNNPGLSQSAIAMALGNDRSAMVFAVDKLEKLGYIERQRCEGDRRSYALHLTKLGQEIQRKARKRVAEHDAKFSSALSGEEEQQLISMLERFISVAP